MAWINPRKDLRFKYMGALSTLFGWNLNTNTREIPDIFPLPMGSGPFIKTDVQNSFQKILTDVVERTHGIPENLIPVLFDNCVQSESSKGLISLLSEAIEEKNDLFLVFKRDLKIIRKATTEERKQIEDDYKARGESSAGVYISFKKFDKIDMIKVYSAMEYCVIGSLNKSMNLSKAIQIKINDLRASTALADSASAIDQGSEMATALREGRDVLMDAKDIIETAMPDLTAIKEALLFLDQKRAFYYGLPTSYLDGEQTPGIGSTGEQDARAVERGLRGYFFQIIKPVIEKVMGITVTYKSQDFRNLETAFNALKIFDLTSAAYLSDENKQRIIEKLLDIEEGSQDLEPKENNVDPIRSNGGAEKNSTQEKNQKTN